VGGSRHRSKPRLGIVELAVDPADVDRDRYPVRIRLTRPLTPFEMDGLAVAEPGMHVEGDALVVPDARLDDIAHDRREWAGRLERVESLAGEREGESMVADHRRVEEQTRHGSHLGSQHEHDRGLH